MSGNLGRRRRGVDGQDVVQVLGVQAQDGDHDLDLVAQTRDERRAQRPVDQAAGQDRVRGRSALTAEERAGDTSCGVHPLLDVDRQGEEVEVVLRALAGRGGRQEHGLVVEVGDDSAGGLLGQPTGLEANGAGAEAPVVDHGGGFVHAVFKFNYRHGCPYGLSEIHSLHCSAVFALSQRVNHRPRFGHGHRSKLPGIRPGSHYRRPRDQACR